MEYIFVYVNWIRLATNPSWLDGWIGGAFQPERAGCSQHPNEVYAKGKLQTKLLTRKIPTAKKGRGNLLKLSKKPTYLQNNIHISTILVFKSALIL